MTIDKTYSIKNFFSFQAIQQMTPCTTKSNGFQIMFTQKLAQHPINAKEAVCMKH